MRAPSPGHIGTTNAIAPAAILLLMLMFLVGAAGLPERSAANGATPTGYNPNDLPVASCFWTGPFTRSNPKTNTAYPGTEITYWGAKFVTPPGAVLTLKGRFPHARYSSLNAYTNNGASTGSLRDGQIIPDAGSINPSIPGRDRSAKNRSYTVTVIGSAKPDDPAPNTLYAAPVDGAHQDIIYRVYIPDKGRDRAGGTGIPEPSLELEDGTVLTGQALCDAMNSIHDYTGNLLPLNVYNLLLNGKGAGERDTNPAQPKLAFGKYFNLPTSLARYGVRNDLEIAWANNPNYVGTQYDNSDARYMTAAYSFDFGQVMALHGRLPTTPTTLNGNRRTAAGQLVAWDMCIVQSLVTTKTYRCVFDEQLPMRSRKRNYLISISSKAERPSNARLKCGVYWMEADPEGDGAGRPKVGQLLTRNVVPSEDFAYSSWSVPTPFAEDAAETMKSFYPRGTYFSKKQFEARGCPFKWR